MTPLTLKAVTLHGMNSRFNSDITLKATTQPIKQMAEKYDTVEYQDRNGQVLFTISIKDLQFFISAQSNFL